MPTSDPCSITAIVTEILRRQPKSVLDLGMGYGKYGMLCCEYLEAWNKRFTRDQWLTRIVGVEAFAGYRTPAWDFYTQVLIEDFSQKPESYTGFDLVLLLDSLEHLDKEIGLMLLETLRKNNKDVIVCIPEGECIQGAVGGNEFECHKATWTAKELVELGGEIFFSGKTPREPIEISCVVFNAAQ